VLRALLEKLEAHSAGGSYWDVVAEALNSSRRERPACFARGQKAPWMPDLYQRYLLNLHARGADYLALEAEHLLAGHVPELSGRCPSNLYVEAALQEERTRMRLAALWNRLSLPSLVVQDACRSVAALNATLKLLAHTESVFLVTSAGGCQAAVLRHMAANHQTPRAAPVLGKDSYASAARKSHHSDTRRSGHGPLDLVLERPGQHPRWDRYLRSVYGDVRYPFSLQTLTWLYWTAPLDAPIRIHCVDSHTRAHVRHGEGFIPKTGKTNSYRASSITSLGFWVARPFMLEQCNSSSTWCEVLRIEKPGERKSVWFHGAVGSGMWLRVGRLADYSCLSGWSDKWYRPPRALKVRMPVPPHCVAHSFNLSAVKLNGRQVPADAHLPTALAPEYETFLRLYDLDDQRMALGSASRVELATTFRSSGTRFPRLAKQHETCGGTENGHLASGSVAHCRCSCSNAVDVLNCGVEEPTLVRELLRSGHGLDRRCFAHHHSSQARPEWFSFDAKEASVTTALASVVRNVKRAHCSSLPTSVVDKPMVPPSNRCRVARDDACGTGYWQPCPQGRAHRWRGETTCAWQPATQQRLLAALASLKARGLPPEIVFFGDSTFRQLYLDALYLGTAANGTADDPSCDPKQARDVELPRGTIITKLGPVVAGETASLLDPRGAGPEAHASGCNVRILREHNALPIPGGGRLRFYFSGQLSCHEPEHQRSLFSILAGGCPGAIVAGHNIWDCRWHQMARMPWPGYSYAADVRNATATISSLCPNSIKIWRTSNVVHVPRSKMGSWGKLPPCLQQNECRVLQQRLVDPAWHFLDAQLVTQPLGHANLSLLSRSKDVRHLAPAAVRAVMSEALRLIVAPEGG
jgi:hypothetical protein